MLCRSILRTAAGGGCGAPCPPRRTVKVLAALYPDPLGGYPPAYARTADLPHLPPCYADGTPLPRPLIEHMHLQNADGGRYKHRRMASNTQLEELAHLAPTAATAPGQGTYHKPLNFSPGELLGCVSGELGLRAHLEEHGHELVVTSDKDGEDSEFERHLSDADVVISQPFYPAYLDEGRLAKAKRLRLAITAGVGSDHVDLKACMKNKVTVAEVSFCNSISVAEHVVMLILASVRNLIPSNAMARASHGHQQASFGARDDGWNIADCVKNAYDLEGMHVGTVGAGRIGLAVLRRLAGFDVHLHYTDGHRLPKAVEEDLKLTFHESAAELARACDVVSINCPLHDATEHLFDDDMIRSNMRRGSYLINTARARIVDAEAVVRALNDGHLAGYAGDVWFPQPAPLDHPWRRAIAPYWPMTPHMSGSTLSAQARYAAGVLEILDAHLAGARIREEYLIVKDGHLAGAGRHSYVHDCRRVVEDAEWDAIHPIPP